MLRKTFITMMLFAQIVLFAVAAGNAKTGDPGPLPPCFPCSTAR